MVLGCKVSLPHLLDYIDDQLSSMQMEWLREHVASGCGRCSDQLRWAIRLTTLMRTDSMVEPPIWVTNRAKRLWPQASEDKMRFGMWLLRSVAQKIMDTRLQPALAGIRGRAALDYRLMYEASSNISIDIQIDQAMGGKAELEGQALIRGGNLGDSAGAAISLWQGREQKMGTEANAFGEFSFSDLMPGRYDLTIDLDGMNIIIPDVEV